MAARMLVATLVVCGCGEPSLEQHHVVAERVLAVAGGARVYWMQAESPQPDAPLGGTDRLFRDAELLDEMSGPVPGEGGRRYIAISDGIVAWGYTGAFTTCGSARLVHDDNTSADLVLFGDDDCHTQVLDVFANDVLFASVRELDGQLAFAIRRYGLATQMFDTLFSLGQRTLNHVLQTGDQIVTSSDAWTAGAASTLDTFARGAPDGLQPFAPVAGNVGGVTSDGDFVYWVENGPTEVSVQRGALEAGGTAETIARLNDELGVAIAHLGSHTWVATESKGASFLVRVDANGNLERFEVPYNVVELVAGASSLYVLIAEDPWNKLVLQPVP